MGDVATVAAVVLLSNRNVRVISASQVGDRSARTDPPSQP